MDKKIFQPEILPFLFASKLVRYIIVIT